MVKSSVVIPKGIVIVKTRNAIFDCIGRVMSMGAFKDANGNTHNDYYMVAVYKYLYSDFSSKDQRYYFTEVINFLPVGEDYKIAELLYTGD